MTGNSSRHGGQYVPMKLTQTGRPLSFARSTVSPPSSGSTRAGAGWPTWNWPAIGERGGSVARGVGDASDGSASEGSSEADGAEDAVATVEAEGDGLGVAVDGRGVGVGRSAAVGGRSPGPIANAAPSRRIAVTM